MNLYPFGSLPYNNYGAWLKRKYNGARVHKVIVDAGFTCPNRDGTKGYGGCTYCNVDAFTPQPARSTADIKAQIEKSMAFTANTYKAEKFIIYFQPNTNTYAPVEKLQELYDTALAVHPDKVVGLSVGTRPDCLDDQKLQLLDSYADKVDVDLEIGMESIYDTTLKAINRQCTHAELVATLQQAQQYRLLTTVHTIFGLPGESHAMQLAVADELNQLPINMVKLHHLYIADKSIMGVKYKRQPWDLYTLESYTDFLCAFLPKLRPDLVIQRLYATSDKEMLIAPKWGLSKRALQQHLEDTFKARNIVQGAAYQPIPSTPIHA